MSLLLPHTVRLLFHPRWSGKSSMKELLLMSLPLLISGLAAVVNLFFDRYFLGSYDLKYHMNASLSAGLLWWTSQMFFNGIASYVATFVAQYTGAKRNSRVGEVVWQGIYLNVIGALTVFLIFPLTTFIVRSFQFDPLYGDLSLKYIWILNFGVFFLLFNASMIGLFSTLGKNTMVILVSVLVTVVNIGLNKWFIFTPPTWLPFVEKGIVGAAWGTTLSFVVGSVAFVALLVETGIAKTYNIKWFGKFDFELFMRLVKYGAPSGLAHVVEVGTFSLFILVLGSVDPIKLGAANIAFTVNNLVFVPLMSIGQAVTILVGSYIGAKRFRHSMRVPFHAIFLGLTTVTFVALSYILVPDLYILLFKNTSEGSLQDPVVFTQMAEYVRVYLLFMALYCVGDIFQIVYGGALRGAGDTAFCMFSVAIGSVLFLALPSLGTMYFGWPDWIMFAMIAIYIYLLSFVFLTRYKQGHWQRISVIEPEVNLLTKEFAR